MNASRLAVCLVGFLLACTQDDKETGDSLVIAGPELSHAPLSGALQQGEVPTITVEAVDEDGVSSVIVYWRTTGVPTWESLELSSDAEGETWSGEIGPLEAPGLEYYFRSTDLSDFQAATVLPENGSSAPYEVPVSVIGATLPWTEDFEGDPSAGLLYNLGWQEYRLGFPGYPWEMTQARSTSGDWGMTHRRGVEGIDPLVDWLVSPPLDFSSEDRIQVTWQETGSFVELSQHSLWISTGSSDPQSGDFQLVADLAPPSADDFARTPVIDLSDWAGSSVAFLAWRYEGQFGDTWYLDDVQVAALGPDLHLIDLSWEPTPLDPGHSGELWLTLENRTTQRASDVEVVVAADPSAVLFEAPIQVGTIQGDAQVQVSIPFSVQPDQPDNSQVPLNIQVLDDTQSWAWQDHLIIGVPSKAVLTVDQPEGGLLQITMGSGDPTLPSFEFDAFVQVVEPGIHEINVDLTSYGAFLPPGPGAERWWARISPATPAVLQDFAIFFDEQTYQGEQIGEIGPTDSETFFLPSPPELSIQDQSTTPSPVQPGQQVQLSLEIYNRGTATTGYTQASLSTDDPSITFDSPDTILLDFDGIEKDQDVSADFFFSVDSSKTDSRPIDFTLTVWDQAEPFEFPVQVGVPFPVLQLTGVRVDDWQNGNNNGLLEPGETAQLEIQITNAGTRDTFGAMNCTLAQIGGAASATLQQATQSYGILSAEETDDQDGFLLNVDVGANGDALEYALTCDDGTGIYTLYFDIVLGEPTWVYLTPLPDAYSDALQAYDFDFVSGQYRCDGVTLDILLESSVPYDPNTLFIEAWGNSTGASYTYYQMVMQSGVGTLRGYELGDYTRLTYPTLTEVSPTQVMLSIDVTAMELALDSVSFGFGTGFCGGDDYYCDHYPDNWGAPYQGFATSLWFDMSW